MEINNYNIYLDINTVKLNYSGKIEINLDITNEINCFKINSKKINIISLKINNFNYKWIENHDKEIIKVDGTFNRSNYIISIEFSNEITDNTEGFYYTKKNNKLILCTDFEPMNARQFIPCFDTPSLKATFDLKIRCPNNMCVISNKSIKNTIIEIQNNLKIVEFNTTPKMSTYLLCVVLGDIVPVLEIPIKTTNGKCKVNGYSIESDVNYMKWSLVHTVKAIDFFSEWFGIDYPLEKLDIVSIPNFSSCAMENWGIITFREEFILLFNNFNTLSKIKILEVIYHEISHQWFGNLVTLSKWDDLWLNESFATYLAWMALHINYPNYNILELYFLLECNSTIQLDAISNTRPIVNITDQSINPIDLFDGIIYGKGSLLINYISDLLVNNTFHKSIINYLKNNMYKNTNSNDIYQEFINSHNNNLNYVNLMKQLITIKGYPILYIETCNNGYKIKIKTFNLNKDIILDYPINIYLKIKYKINGQFQTEIIILKNNDDSFIDESKTNNLIINPNNKLFCICYWDKIVPNIKNMNQIEIIKFLYDEYILSIYGYKEIFNFLNIINIIFKEIDFNNFILLLYSILLNLNNLFRYYYLSNKNPINIINFIKDNFYNKIKLLLKNYLLNTPTFYELTIDQIFIFGAININDLELINIIKKIYDCEFINKYNFDYLTNSIYKIIIKYFENTEFNNILEILKKSDNINNINNSINSFQYLSMENFKLIFDNYTVLIKSQEHSLFLYSISESYDKQEFIYDFEYDNNGKISHISTNQFILLEIISKNILDVNLILKIVDYIKSILLKKNKSILLKKIIDILESNILIYNNLI